MSDESHAEMLITKVKPCSVLLDPREVSHYFAGCLVKVGCKRKRKQEVCSPPPYKELPPPNYSRLTPITLVPFATPSMVKSQDKDSSIKLQGSVSENTSNLKFMKQESELSLCSGLENTCDLRLDPLQSFINKPPSSVATNLNDTNNEAVSYQPFETVFLESLGCKEETECVNSNSELLPTLSAKTELAQVKNRNAGSVEAYDCDRCFFRYDKKDIFMNHMRLDDILNKTLLNMPCMFCKKLCENLQKLDEHVKKSHHVCQSCNENFETELLLSMHHFDHKLDLIYNFKCTMCFCELRSNADLLIHLHEKHNCINVKNSMFQKIKMSLPKPYYSIYDSGNRTKCPYCNLYISHGPSMLHKHFVAFHNMQKCLKCSNYLIIYSNESRGSNYFMTCTNETNDVLLSNICETCHNNHVKNYQSSQNLNMATVDFNNGISSTSLLENSQPQLESEQFKYGMENIQDSSSKVCHGNLDTTLCSSSTGRASSHLESVSSPQSHPKVAQAAQALVSSSQDSANHDTSLQASQNNCPQILGNIDLNDFKIFECIECKNKFYDKLDLIKHKCIPALPVHNSTHNSNHINVCFKYQCKLCVVNFVNYCSLQIHCLKIHDMKKIRLNCPVIFKDGQKIFKCGICCAKFYEPRLFYAHCSPYTNYTHLVNHCVACDLHFKLECEYTEHCLNVHQGLGLFACKICDDALPFKHLTSLENHIETRHHTTMVFCRYKVLDYIKEYYINTHAANCVNKNSTQSCDYCIFCKERIFDPKIFPIHIRSHFNKLDSLFFCKFCLNYFPTKDNLKFHIVAKHSSKLILQRHLQDSGGDTSLVSQVNETAVGESIVQLGEVSTIVEGGQDPVFVIYGVSRSEIQSSEQENKQQKLGISDYASDEEIKIELVDNPLEYTKEES